ncbi:hypothetical protein H6G53_04205 [Limnothrix sp. FACHB-406]|uniref:hypothetical protein n=1 Tax=unclassified Limnothrix TaxID=2632864 RepID=UPI001680DBAD|nr:MULTISPECIES: hypothetical protein [unclassified Limnothrix]MBD2159314.1 hypothetical protein [Limnothrix sp. FACHB-1083]MBD2589908.1 hypothetical protein [Limnothrix sp. FACHB-406]
MQNSSQVHRQAGPNGNMDGPDAMSNPTPGRSAVPAFWNQPQAIPAIGVAPGEAAATFTNRQV